MVGETPIRCVAEIFFDQIHEEVQSFIFYQQMAFYNIRALDDKKSKLADTEV